MDMDAFFASVELKKRPELKGRPVIVGGSGDSSKRGVVSAASYEARKFGVSSGMPLKKAKQLCPAATFLPVDFEAYEKESERFMEILRGHGELVESFGLDEAFLELRLVPGADPFEASIAAAREIKDTVKKELGLTISVGIGPNKLVAKMASDMNKPDGFTVIRTKEVEGVFSALAVRKIFGIGAKTEERLKKLGINTAGDLRKLTSKYLEATFGKSFGTMLYDHCRGIDSSPVVPFHEPSSFSREVTFESDTRDKYFIKETVAELTKDLAATLRNDGYLAKTVTVKARFSDFKTITRAVSLEAETDSFDELLRAAFDALTKVELSARLRLVGVKLSALKKSR